MRILSCMSFVFPAILFSLSRFGAVLECGLTVRRLHVAQCGRRDDHLTDLFIEPQHRNTNDRRGEAKLRSMGAVSSGMMREERKARARR